MMEESFIEKFINGLLEVPGALFEAWASTSYKGFSPNKMFNHRISGREYYGFKNLEKRGIIKFKNPDEFFFTSGGHEWLKKARYKYAGIRHLKRSVKWDKKWRIIMFDIPNDLHKQRVNFSRKLISLGCAMFEKSVFVYPFSCHEEITEVAKMMDVVKYVDMITAESIGPKEKDLKIYFRLN
ncbi:MAG: hypothetical protein A2669_01120 [Candidatus Yanofskybacteria bacterium RIFCSPHIGHO2_01_FULL_48_25b]|uniref:Transcriptional repressor PaaX-like central Cas2-like domain-containing protein n=2 Tax=Parcubacteria group TaxID=1794811 RepID=A0A1F8EYK0_9BACT|nr:MAG: hypothetical protein A2669_01120 [Candidatus Yanofskybacteria bacterium RIFCSPHIGHO2_01_FULL_48_25b]